MNHTDVVIERTATIGTYGGSGAMFFGGVTANEIAALGGLLVGFTGLAISWYYKHKEDRRKEQIHQKQLKEFSVTGGVKK